MVAGAWTTARAARAVLAIGWADFTLKYRGSALGWLWSFVAPLAKFLVLYHVFRSFLGFDTEHYALYLFLGIILWEHFALVTSACIALPHDKQAIIAKVPFPRVLLALAAGWTALLVFATHAVIFLIAAAMLGVRWTPGSAYAFLVILQLLLLSLGAGMLLGAYALRFRDVAHLWSVLLQILFWLSPIAYVDPYDAPLSVAAQEMLHPRSLLSLPGFFDAVIRFQPLSVILHDARRALLYPVTHGVPSLEHAAVVTVGVALLFALGALVFHRRSASFLQEY